MSAGRDEPDPAARAAPAGDGSAGARSLAILEEIRRIARTDLGIAFTVEPGHELVRDLRLDSMTALVLAVGLEDHFRVSLDESDTAHLTTVGDLVARVERRLERA